MEILAVTGYNKALTDVPNTECIYSILNELSGIDDVNVTVAGDVMTSEESEKNWKTHPIIALRRIAGWPVRDPGAADRCYKDVLEKMREKKYDAMIAFLNPYEAVRTAVKIKRKYPGMLFIIYEIDPITNDIDMNIGLGKKLRSLAERSEKKAFESADLIIHMNSNRNKFDRAEYSEFSQKNVYVDLPIINEIKKYEGAGSSGGDEIKVVFSGRLSSVYRSPEYILRVFEKAEKNTDLKLYFYSRGDCQKRISEYAHEHDFLSVNDYVDASELDRILREADFLLDIGNKMSDMLPSKLFNYISYRKPIIHVSSKENDACVPYLERYGIYTVIDEGDTVEHSADKLTEFVSKNKGRLADEALTEKEFYTNTPAYSAKVIAEQIKMRCQK